MPDCEPVAHLTAGVAMDCNGDADVGLLLGSLPTADTAYTVPGFNPTMAQFDVWQITVMGLPPPNGVQVTVKGPVTPGPGRIIASAVVGLVGSTASVGALQHEI